MTTIELTTDNFDEVTSGNDFVIIDFSAEWGRPCTLGPAFEQVSNKHEGVVLARSTPRHSGNWRRHARSHRSPPS